MSTVLAVDDSKPMLAMLSKCLSNGGHNVVKAMDGVEALEQLKAHRPDSKTAHDKSGQPDGSPNLLIQTKFLVS